MPLITQVDNPKEFNSEVMAEIAMKYFNTNGNPYIRQLFIDYHQTLLNELKEMGVLR